MGNMGGKITSTYKNNKHNPFCWKKSRKQRSSLFAKFLNLLLYTKNHDLIPHSILLEEIPFPTDTDNWSMQEYHIWSSSLELLNIRSNYGCVNKVKLNEKVYIEMKFLNDMYDVGFSLLIDHLRSDYYYWKYSQDILDENIQDDSITTKRSFSPVSSNSDDHSTISTISSYVESYHLFSLSPPKKRFGDKVPFEKVEELLINVQLKYGTIRKKKGYNNVWIWKESNRDSGNGVMSNLQLLN